MGIFEDFPNYARGIKRLERFLPRASQLIILVLWGIAAWKWHIVLVVLACAAFFVANYATDLANGLIVEGEALRDRLSGLESGAEGVSDADVLGDQISDEDHAKGLRPWSDYEPSVMRLENEIRDLKLELQNLKGRLT
jgi:hypothetical protein